MWTADHIIRLHRSMQIHCVVEQMDTLTDGCETITAIRYVAYEPRNLFEDVRSLLLTGQLDAQKPLAFSAGRCCLQIFILIYL